MLIAVVGYSNIFGTPTGKVEHVREGELLPHGPRGFTWRQIVEEGSSVHQPGTMRLAEGRHICRAGHPRQHGVYERWLRSQPRQIAALPLRITNCGVCLGAP